MDMEDVVRLAVECARVVLPAGCARLAAACVRADPLVEGCVRVHRLVAECSRVLRPAEGFAQALRLAVVLGRRVE